MRKNKLSWEKWKEKYLGDGNSSTYKYLNLTLEMRKRIIHWVENNSNKDMEKVYRFICKIKK